FGYGTIDLHHFPLAKWRKFMNRSLLPENSFHLLYGDIQGEIGLRKEIASYLHQNRGVRCSPDQIVIGAGTFHSLDLLFQLIQNRTTSIAVESSVHVGVKALLNKFPFQVEPLDLELDGINLNKLKKKEVQAIYLTPSYQFPYGMTLSINKRIKLLKYATENQFYIIENDYDGEFRYNNRPIPSLQSLDNNGRVIYLGTFSKSLTPSFRISYLVLPTDLLCLFHLGKHSYDQHASPIFQKTLQWFMESGDFERHMRKMRTLYQKKHAIITSRFSDIFEDKIEIVGAGAGLHIVIKVKNDMDELKLIDTAKQFGVNVYPTSIYKIENHQEQDNILLLGFGGLSETAIEEGLRLLKIAWFPNNP
ncbi:MocR-like pyridoxine biosynthesis transcription factor PdxR, partial [Metabacillus niabensis]